MSGPDPAVAAVRLAVRRSLADAGPAPVLVACSGGADSLALLAAAAFERRRGGDPLVGVTVDHGLQPGSADHARAVARQMAALGATETMTITVRVEAPGLGPEAAARQARYAALSQAAERLGSALVLLGHTRDDQAETVLLGLARGSGGRSIAGMRRSFTESGVRFARPLLDLTRSQTEQACRAQDLTWWDDPHNQDPRFTRPRVRQRVLPLLEAELGPGVGAALARTADLLQDDLAALDDLAQAVLHAVRGADGGLDASAVAAHPPAVLTRVLRRAAVAAGASGSETSKVHVDALVRLLRERPEGGGPVQLPGGVTAYTEGGVLRFQPTGGG